jgi:4-alpha-glucanotransferase
MNPPTLSTRAAGVLLHPTSLPGPYGAGDLGPEAYQFADLLAGAGQRWWQMLPVTPPGPAPEFSPYSSHSAFAGSPWLISPELLHQQNLLSKADLDAAVRPVAGRINFPRLQKTRGKLLHAAFANRGRLSRGDHAQFENFIAENAAWLDDYALYAAIRQSRGGESWLRWPADIRLRRAEATATAKQHLGSAVEFQQFVQWLFDRQWTALKKYCNDHGIGLIGDIPIFVALDSAAVWARRDLFFLRPDGRPTVVSGYPPDIFSPGGQLWGHPHYRWSAHIAEGFAWWLARFERLFQQFDAVRVDHFLGFHRVWAVPAGEKNAIRGRWLSVPGDPLFQAAKKRFGDAPIIAEDLGKQTAKAIALRDKYGFPGMRIIQFAFGEDTYHCPHTFPHNCVAYTGTHDNQTVVGWFDSLKNGACNGERARALAYVGGTAKESHWNFIRALYASAAQTVIVPVQDILGLGAEHRMNIPGVLEGNWGWRMSGPIPRHVITRLRELSEATRRAIHSNTANIKQESQADEQKENHRVVVKVYAPRLHGRRFTASHS